MTPFAKIDSWADIPDAIARMQAAGAEHRIPLLQGLYRGQIAHLEIHRGTSASMLKRWFAAAKLPSVLLIGDDDYAVPDGPDTWPLAERALRWARGVIVHGGKGEPSHYFAAVSFAQVLGHLVLVECSSANIPAWHDAAARWGAPPVLTFGPERGKVHPVHIGERAH